MQDFEEAQVWPLTSPTTCYTGAVAVDASDGSAKWATERHSCQVHSLIVDDDSNSNGKSNAEPLFSWNSLTVPENNRKDELTIAVGYSACRDWEAVALLDVSNLPADSTTTAATPSPGQPEDPHEFNPGLLIRRDSEVSVKTAASNAMTINTSAGLTQSQQSQSQSQQTSQRGMHRHQMSTERFPSMDSLSMAAITEHSETHQIPQQPEQPQQHQAQLILRERKNDTVTSTGDTTAATSTATTAEYAVKLDFRPLAPLVCQFPVATTYKDALSSASDGGNNNDNDNSSSSNDSIVTGVFLGSADNHKLHWFIPSDANAALESIDLQDVMGRNDSDKESQAIAPAFVFESSVMALAFCAGSVPTKTDDNDDAHEDNMDNYSGGNDHCLVVACQDGAIRLITFWYAQGIFTRVQHTTIVVDGPLVCLQVRYLPSLNVDTNSSERRRRHVVVGSLCGYVTELYETASADGLSSSLSRWDGPYMVAEGLWNQKLKSEDSVLAVHAYGDNSVVLGTQSGRCLLYQKYGDAYELVWECRLPYSIHAICHVPAVVPVVAPTGSGNATSMQPRLPLPPALLVTTRRSVHLLTPKRPRYSASLAKERLEKLLQRFKPAPSPVQDKEQEQDLEKEPEAEEPPEDNDETQKLEEIPVSTTSTSTPPVESTSDDIVTATDIATEELPTSLSSSSSPPPASVLVDQSSPQAKVE